MGEGRLDLRFPPRLSAPYNSPRETQSGAGRPNCYLQSSKSSCKSTKYRGISEKSKGTQGVTRGSAGGESRARGGGTGRLPGRGRGAARRPRSLDPLTRHLGMGWRAGLEAERDRRSRPSAALRPPAWTGSPAILGWVGGGARGVAMPRLRPTPFRPLLRGARFELEGGERLRLRP